MHDPPVVPVDVGWMVWVVNGTGGDCCIWHRLGSICILPPLVHILILLISRRGLDGMRGAVQSVQWQCRMEPHQKSWSSIPYPALMYLFTYHKEVPAVSQIRGRIDSQKKKKGEIRDLKVLKWLMNT